KRRAAGWIGRVVKNRDQHVLENLPAQVPLGVADRLAIGSAELVINLAVAGLALGHGALCKHAGRGHFAVLEKGTVALFLQHRGNDHDPSNHDDKDYRTNKDDIWKRRGIPGGPG